MGKTTENDAVTNSIATGTLPLKKSPSKLFVFGALLVQLAIVVVVFAPGIAASLLPLLPLWLVQITALVIQFGLFVNKKTRSVAVSIAAPLGIFVLAQLSALTFLGIPIPELLEEGAEAGTAGQFLFVVSFGLLSLVLLRLYMKLRKHGLDWLGLGAWPKLKDMLWVFPAAGAYIVTVVTLFSVVEMLQIGVDLDQEQDVGFGAVVSPVELILAFLALVVVVPLVEEILIRGFMFRALSRVFGFGLAALVSASIFGLLHGQVNLFIDTFALGLALAWLVHKTDSLWPAIALHALKNFAAFLYLFVF